MAKESVKVTLLSDTAYESAERGHVDGKAGETVEATPHSAGRLIALGKAKPVKS